MKKISYILVIIFISISCSSNNENENIDNIKSTKEEPKMTKAKPSADYSSLFNNYTCDLTAEEFAEATGIAISTVEVAKSYSPNHCYFNLSGFGNKPFILRFGSTKSRKADIKKEIDEFLKREKNNENIMGMAIQLSETGDSYITLTPHVGRVNILNENYDNAFFFEFGQRGIHKGRTKDLQEDLTQKMVILGNYLLKKHKK